MTEAQITKAVIDHWRTFGRDRTLVASIPNMRAMGQYGLTKGLPDLLVIGEPNKAFKGTGFIELKKTGGKLSEAQKAFQTLCIANGVNHSVTHGRDEPIAILEHWGIVKEQVKDDLGIEKS